MRFPCFAWFSRILNSLDFNLAEIASTQMTSTAIPATIYSQFVWSQFVGACDNGVREGDEEGEGRVSF